MRQRQAKAYKVFKSFLQTPFPNSEYFKIIFYIYILALIVKNK